MPYFSIVIPTYNRAHLISPTIESVLQQEFSDFELLVIDDGSTDNTRALIEGYQRKDTRVHYYFKQNNERGAARNFGIGKSKGEFIVFLDSDDILRENHLKVLHTAARSNPKINFIAAKYDILLDGKFKENELASLREGFYGINLVLEGNPFSCNFCVRRENPNLILFREEPEFVIIEDWVFLVENLFKDKIYLVDEVSAYMVDHPSRSMRSHNEVLIRKRLFALNWLLEKYPFSHSQIKVITGFSFYFCAIHCYIDGDLRKGLQYLYRSLKCSGLSIKNIHLLIKLLLGKRLIHIVSKLG
jgi:glycosyltransferase involved in cell wall biosynthesis